MAFRCGKVKTITNGGHQVPFPDRETLMGALLELAADGEVHILKDTREPLADKFKLTPEERAAAHPNGLKKFPNDVAWAAVKLGQAGYVTRPAKGQIQIT